VMVAGFAFLANLLYGSTIESFHNLPSSFSTLLRFPLGDFDYHELQTVGVFSGAQRRSQSPSPLLYRGLRVPAGCVWMPLGMPLSGVRSSLRL
jgi:hypothetical protein